VPRVTGDETAPATRGEIAATALVIGTLAVAVSYARFADRFHADASPEECATLMDRYVEHRAHAAMGKVTDAELARDQARVREAAARHAAFSECPDRLPREKVECAMHANNADEFERCLQ
jgi:hypothetical protein